MKSGENGNLAASSSFYKYLNVFVEIAIKIINFLLTKENLIICQKNYMQKREKKVIREQKV